MEAREILLFLHNTRKAQLNPVAIVALRVIPFPITEVLPQFAFQQFSGGGIGKLIYENEGVRDLPTGETPLQKDAQFAGIDRGTVVED